MSSRTPSPPLSPRPFPRDPAILLTDALRHWERMERAAATYAAGAAMRGIARERRRASVQQGQLTEVTRCLGALVESLTVRGEYAAVRAFREARAIRKTWGGVESASHPSTDDPCDVARAPH